jgi:O-antigen/teichoic acid export membrane protein
MRAARWDQVRRIARLVVGFSLGQGALQGINLLTGIYLVHTLSIEAYAQFGLAFGFQTALATLMDLGFAGTIIPLVGERTADKAHVGRYVRAAKHLRDRTFWILSPVAAIAFLGITHSHHWTWTLQGALLLSVFVALYSGGAVSYFSASLILYGKLRRYYLPQTISAMCRLLVSVLLGTLGLLNAWMAAALGALGVTLNAWLLGKEGTKLFVWTAKHDPSASKEIVRYVLPAIPAVIFSAFQMQIGLLLISIFGQTVNIAQVAAVGRISQIFAVLTTFNMIIVEPRVARLPQALVFSFYCRMIAFGITFAGIMTLSGIYLPGIYILILGAKYEALRGLMGWVVMTACVSYVANLFWVMNRARRWLFWRGTLLEIGLTLLVDVGYVSFFGVRTTRNAVLFSLASSLCGLATHFYIAVYGFKRGPRLQAVVAAKSSL